MSRKKTERAGRFPNQIIVIALAVALVDQITKLLIRKSILNVPFALNTGSAFSMFKGANYILAGIAVIFIIVMLYAVITILPQEKKAFYGAGLMIGGAIGNLTDRIFLGAVVDFINLKVWPSFNIADSCIVIGACVLGFVLLFSKDESGSDKTKTKRKIARN